MTILQIGFAKSGNMLLHVILRTALEQADIAYRSVICNDSKWLEIQKKNNFIYNSDIQPSIDVLDIQEDGCCRYIVSSLYEKPISDLCNYISNCSIIWSHSPYVAEISEQLLGLVDAAFYIMRDGRGVLNSMAHYIETKYMRENFGHHQTARQFLCDYGNCRSILRAWKRHVENYCGIADDKLMLIRYEDLLQHKRRLIIKILKHIGLYERIKPERIDAIIGQSSPKAMRHQMPEHVRKCSPNDWKQHFDHKLIDLCDYEIGIFLSKMGYSQHAG